METKFIYSIYDGRAKMYMDPFVAFNDNIAMRDFQKSCMNPDPMNPLQMFAEDYSLVCIGVFSITGGFVESTSESPKTICRASAYKKEV